MEQLILRKSPRSHTEKPAWVGPLRLTREEPIRLELRPLTVLIGPQASGKSLLMQLMFFFRTLPHLAIRYLSEEQADESVERMVLYLLNTLRRGYVQEAKRGFYALVEGSVDITWEGDRQTYTATIYGTRSDKIGISAGFRGALDFPGWRDFWLSQAITSLYIPAERTLYARLWNIAPAAFSGDHMPLTIRLFSTVMGQVLEEYRDMMEAVERYPETYSNVQWLLEQGRVMLRGQAYLPERGPRLWKWETERGGRRIIHDLELASSGQMAGWTIVVLAAMALYWKRSGRIPETTPFYFHVEEPETHLHPEAQIRMMELLAFLARQGIYVTVTTHSPLFLYVLNPLMEAAALGEEQAEDLPPPQVRIPPENVAAYEVRDGRVVDIVDREKGWVDEDRLREAEWMADRFFNRIRAVLAEKS